jgi:DNA-binding IclR family transcriptional regulator
MAENASIAKQSLGGSKVLTRGLEVLRLLIEAKGPVTSTDIAKKVGLHQSSVSRILNALMRAGYVRKPDYHSFAVNYGVITLSGNASSHFALSTKPRAVMEEMAERNPGTLVALGALWRGDLIYFLRVQNGQETIKACVMGWPLHLSSVAMRLLVDLPKDEAIEILDVSRRRFGWDRPTPAIPATAEGCLSAAKKRMLHDCMILSDWNNAGTTTAAIPLDSQKDVRVCLAISGSNLPDQTSAILILQEGRRAVDMALTAG